MIRNKMDPVVQVHNPMEVIQNKETGKPETETPEG
jgi:hypothetical protein